MGIGSPLFERTQALCKTMKWKEWAGYYAAEKYDTAHDLEYFAIREAAGLLDVSPLFKYDIKGKDALRLVDRVLARDAHKVKDGMVAYSTWCDEQGKVIDDGTVFRFSQDHWRISSANPTFRWLSLNSRGLDVTIEDTSTKLAAMALQGPQARNILNGCAGDSLDTLRFFRMMDTKIGKVPVTISRTGYTGDLGYEIWVPADKAVQVWDAVMEAGQNYNIMAAGLLALDMTRVEAGFILIDVDFKSTHHCIIEDQKSSPYEIGLGWTVHLEKAPFIGQKALQAEHKKGSPWSIVGIEMDMEELERLFDKQGLPTALSPTAWRSIIPIYDPGSPNQVGWATSGLWSPVLKKNIAIATVKTEFAQKGTRLKIETLVEYTRELITARVVDKPFFDPPRKKAIVEAAKPQLATV